MESGNSILGLEVSEGGYEFVHTIQPSELVSISEQNRPDFSDPNIQSPPGVLQPVFGTELSGGVNEKWDSSRQIRAKRINPFDILPSELLSPTGPDFFDYPTNDVEGNDDSSTNDEINSPESFDGTLIGWDYPNQGITHRTGNNGDTYERRYHFREFARLEFAAGKWHRISNFFLWKIHFKFKKVNGQWVDNGSVKELNNDGF